MQEKMNKFLLSIGIQNPALFDLAFDNIKAANGIVYLSIKKESKWAYFELSEFLMKISNISYKFEMSFNYSFEITPEIVRDLFLEFYQAERFSKFEDEFNQDDVSIIEIDADRQKQVDSVVQQFNEILNFICYPIKMSTKIKEIIEEPKLEEVDKPKVDEAILEEHSFDEEILTENEDIQENSEEVIEEEILDGGKLIEQDRKKSLEDANNYLIQQAELNLQKMKDERERARIWKTGDYTPVSDFKELLTMNLCNVDIDGEVFDLEIRQTKKGSSLLSFGIGSYSGAIYCRAFEGRRFSPETMAKFKNKQKVRVRGALEFDTFKSSRGIVAHFIDILPSISTREDTCENKRVELHLHTKMSSMDGCAEIGDYVNLATRFGMHAIALTDHGVIQSFPAAQKAVKDARKVIPDFKMIYGCEFYAFSTKNDVIVQNPVDVKLKDSSFVVFDTETTGLSPNFDRIIEFGAVLFVNGLLVDRFSALVNPDFDLSLAREALVINKISIDDIKAAEPIEKVLADFMRFIGDRPLVAHNASFDISMVNAELERQGKEKLKNTVIDTLAISRYLFPNSAKHNEGALLRNLNLDLYRKEKAHRASYDAELLAQGFLTIVDRLVQENPDFLISDLGKLTYSKPEPLQEGETDPEKIEEYNKAFDTYVNYCKHFKETHLIALAKNQKGLEALYKLVTDAHVTYLGKVPRIPLEEVNAYRENLVLGSACYNGNVFDDANTKAKEELIETIKFYDYIEIQPLENYSFLLDTKRIPSKDRLISILKEIISAAKEAGKPVVATGDCHYLNPEDKILRDIIIQQNAIGGGLHPLNPSNRFKFGSFENPDQHFRTTKEMLDSFTRWLSKEDAYEYVVTNSNKIADLIDGDVKPIYSETYPPNANVPGADAKIRDLCYKNFEERYCGNNNPVVKERIAEIKHRLDQELNGIIENGYSVTYYVAQQLIKMANEEPEHYIVGSRGSVGSSFAATMADITEVNPLPPHYICPHCHYLEWGEKEYKSGYDLPDKNCPECGHKMKADGQNIPFATFLGFHAEKVPDIDLNFEDESQKKAFDYTKKILGAKNVFRAGTIQTVKTKIAYGYTAKFLEGQGLVIDNNQKPYVAFIANKLEGIKRTTGQHAGGVIVVPSDHDVFEFTAVQYPADEASSKWLTTHYEFKYIHDEILKFDILGHLDPMAMRYYRDLTKIDINEIPMNDKRVISLFASPKELGLKHNYLGWKNGAAGLPEFGTTLGLSLLEEAQPTSFNDLLIIEGLSHGTNVWKGNAQDLIRSGKTLDEVIGCRDDIMTYLISCGIDNGKAFKIMEDVRHGKKLSDEFEALMRSVHIPEYYIESCNKIAYLFPRGHAAAYATMAVRVAYFKLYYPLEFYAVYFSIRSDDWNISTLVKGEQGLLEEYNALKARDKDRKNPLSVKEENILATDQIALEMLDRGYYFSNINLYKSDATMFVVDHENKCLIPPFVCIAGLGEAAALSIIEAREDGKGEFISEEDLLKRASKLNNTSLNKLKELGVLEGLSVNDQLSLF